MRRFGYSTGTLAKGDIGMAMSMLNEIKTDAVEYSALRYQELDSSITHLMSNGVGNFGYVSFHAPSKFEASEEESLVQALKRLVEKFALQIVVHPDAIHDHTHWRRLGSNLCVENMDHRKPAGRTADELDDVFRKLPEARLCFDIGHAHEIDRSMLQGYEILRRHGSRLAQVHASEVSDQCRHRAFTESSRNAFTKLAEYIPKDVPVILETVTTHEKFSEQLKEAREIFTPPSK